MASRSRRGDRDVERAYDAVDGAERDLYAHAPDAVLRIGTACVLIQPLSKVGTAFDMRCGYDRRVRTVVGTMCERVTERALRALLVPSDAAEHGRLRSTSPKAVAYSWSTRQLLGHPRGLVGVSEEVVAAHP